METKISSKVLGMRFMARAMEKKQAVKAETREEDTNNDDSSLIARATAAGQRGCVVLLEGDPPATSGRLSFKGFKTAPEDAYQRVTSALNLSGQDGVVVDDVEMTKLLGKKKEKGVKAQEQTGTDSLSSQHHHDRNQQKSQTKMKKRRDQDNAIDIQLKKSKKNKL